MVVVVVQGDVLVVRVRGAEQLPQRADVVVVHGPRTALFPMKVRLLAADGLHKHGVQLAFAFHLGVMVLGIYGEPQGFFPALDVVFLFVVEIDGEVSVVLLGLGRFCQHSRGLRGGGGLRRRGLRLGCRRELQLRAQGQEHQQGQQQGENACSCFHGFSFHRVGSGGQSP